MRKNYLRTFLQDTIQTILANTQHDFTHKKDLKTDTDPAGTDPAEPSISIKTMDAYDMGYDSMTMFGE